MATTNKEMTNREIANKAPMLIQIYCNESMINFEDYSFFR